MTARKGNPEGLRMQGIRRSSKEGRERVMVVAQQWREALSMMGVSRRHERHLAV